MGSSLVSSYGILDVTLVPLGMLIFALYHFWLYHRIRKDPLKTVIGVNHLAKRAWVQAILADQDKKNILAVQTLRNSVMASSLFATTAIVLSSAIATIVTSRDIRAFAPVVLGSKDFNVLWAKFVLIFAAFVVAFMCHIQSIRYLNHVSFLINIPMDAETGDITPEYVVAGLVLGAHWYTIGTRSFYLASTLMLWLFGSIPMFVGIILLVPFLYYQDICSGKIEKTWRENEGKKTGSMMQMISQWKRRKESRNGESARDEPIPDID